jgi:hypothetical protein
MMIDLKKLIMADLDAKMNQKMYALNADGPDMKQM